MKIKDLLSSIKSSYLINENLVKQEEVIKIINKDIKGISIDTRSIKEGEVFFCIKGKIHNGHDFIETALEKKASGVVFSEDHLKPPPNKENIAFIKVDDTTNALLELAAWHRQNFNIPLICITGSAGKTSTKELIFSILQKKFTNIAKSIKSYNNHIGLALSLLNIKPATQIGVFELGMNHPGEIAQLSQAARPTIAVLTCILPAHIGFFKSIEDIALAKEEIFQGLPADSGIAVLNADDKFIKKFISKYKTKYRVFSYGIKTKKNTTLKAENIKADLGLSFDLVFEDKRRIDINMRSVIGSFNIYNVLAAAVVGDIFGVDILSIKNALESFSLPEHRMELIKTPKFFIIDDCYNANPASMLLALRDFINFNLSGIKRRVVILGDMLELGKEAINFHRKVANFIDKTGRINVVLSCGDLASIIIDNIKNAKIKKFKFSDVEALVSDIEKYIKDKDFILVKGSRNMHLEKVVEKIKTLS